MKEKIIVGAIIAVIACVVISSCSGTESEYETAGKTFGSWANTDPSGWSDTQRDYFDNFMDWADKN